MHKESRGLTIATALLVLAGYVALYTVESIGATALLAPFIMLFVAPLGVWADGRYAPYRRLSGTISVIVLLCLPVMTMAWGLLDTVTFLLVYIQAYELAHRKEIRNYYHIFLMSFFLLLSACAREPNAGIAVVIGLFLMSAVWAFFLLEIASATRGSRRHSAPDIIPLHTTSLVNLPPATNTLRNGVILSATMMSVASVMLTVVLFMATPRMEAGVFGRSRAPESRVQDIGLSQNVSLAGGRILVNRGTPVMRVKFPNEPGGIYDRELYWRSHALNQYTGRAFEVARMPVRGNLEDNPTTRLRTRTLRGGTVVRTPWDENNRIVDQSIVLSTPGPQFPVLATPTRVESSTHGLEWASYSPGDILVGRSIHNTVFAEASSEIYNPTPDELRTAPDNYRAAFHLRNYGSLTREDLEARTRNLAKEITANADNAYDKCVAIERFLGSAQFSYSLDLPPLPDRNAIDYFLWETQTGHCQLYASAMALMVRSIGIPARVVNGYRGGRWDPADEVVVVTSDMAHSWVEAYFLGYGWVRFDPAPPPEEDEGTGTSIIDFFQRFALNSRIFWYQSVVGYQGGFQLSQLRDLNIGDLFGSLFDGEESEGTTAEAPSGNAGLLWLALLVFSGVLLIWSVRNRPRLASTTIALTADQRRAQRLFLKFRETMRKRGIDTTNASAADLLAHRHTLAPEHQEECDALIEAYNRARFGERPLEQIRFRDFIASVKEFGRNR